jgi:hypothetical protein
LPPIPFVILSATVAPASRRHLHKIVILTLSLPKRKDPLSNQIRIVILSKAKDLLFPLPTALRRLDIAAD